MARPDPIETLGEGVARLEERKRLTAELAARQWTESDYQDLIAMYQADPDSSAKLAILEKAIEQAKKEGRYRDDLSPYFENVRRRLKPEQWALRTGEVSLAAEYARHLDAVERVQLRQAAQSTTTIPQPTAQRHTYENAALTFMRELHAGGRISQEQHLGVIASGAAPEWLQTLGLSPIQAAGGVSRRATAEELAEYPWLEPAQTMRWNVWEQAYKLIFTALRRNEKLATIEEALPYKPGYSWEPCEPATMNQAEYAAATRAASNWLSNHASEVAKAVSEQGAASAGQFFRQQMAMKGWSEQRITDELAARNMR